MGHRSLCTFWQCRRMLHRHYAPRCGSFGSKQQFKTFCRSSFCTPLAGHALLSSLHPFSTIRPSHATVPFACLSHLVPSFTRTACLFPPQITTLVCTACGKPCRTDAERDMHTRMNPGHDSYEDRTGQAPALDSEKEMKAARAEMRDTEMSEAGTSGQVRPGHWQSTVFVCDPMPFAWPWRCSSNC